jgi:hypothetical protein
LIFTLVVASADGAANAYYAGPAGTGSACTQMNPCTIPTAVSSAADGDEVIVLPGSYSLGSTTVNVTGGIEVHGQDGASKPMIIGVGAGGGLDGLFQVSDPNAELRQLDIESSGQQGIVVNTGKVEEVFAHASGGNGFACQQLGPGSIRDSVCWGSGSSESGIGAHSNGATFNSTLRNVTAIGTNAGIDFSPSGTSDMITVDAKNVIADGGDAADVVADSCASSGSAHVTIEFAHSNFDTSFLSCDATVSTPSESGNQSALPEFANREGGDFREAPGSPTIDAGVADPSNGITDIDGNPRFQGAAPDIGAYETFPPSPIPIDRISPNTGIGREPHKKTESRHAKFTFFSTESGSTFICRLDHRSSFKPCTSPQRIRVGVGRHRFAVKSVDPAGNIDTTPAVYRWRVVASRAS